MAIKLADYDCKLINPIPEETLIDNIENSYRICYNSEYKILDETFDQKIRFIMKKIKAGHHSPLEHSIFTMKSIVDRGVLAELTRHRIASSFSVQSTRYIAYKDEIEIIIPIQLRSNKNLVDMLIMGAENSYDVYKKMLVDNDVAPQNARAILPMCLKTELIHSHNLRELYHILNLRYFGTTGAPHPDKICQAA